jgi:alpha-galactosidase
MILNVDNFWTPGQINGKRPTVANSSLGNYRWAPEIAQSWRTDTDIGFTGSILWRNVLRNLDHDASHWRAAGRGHWNDPDYLGPGLGMTAAEARAQLSMWAVAAAPLILGSDPRRLGGPALAMLENRQVIAIDQDPLGVQGRPVAQWGTAQVWSKPLAGSQRAIALLNRGPGARWISVSAKRAGLRPARFYRVLDVWTGTTRSTRTIGARVPGNSVVLYRVGAQ